MNRLEQDLSKKTDAAAAEGAANVQGYAQQAKELATSAVNSVQVCLRLTLFFLSLSGSANRVIVPATID